MQTLDVISVNLWQIVISLLNLVLLFLLVKKFLFKPVMKVLEQRQKQIDDRYAEADEARTEAQESRRTWEEKLAGAEAEADTILQTATENARRRGDKLVAEARDEADSIVRMARNEAQLERQKAAAGIKQEIVEVSGALAEKLLEREINRQDHRALIDSFIEEIGDEND
ncbi:MAG: F0F1 ATP synthase subunit B [Oscillospiraceae bacterium]|nr:F0F1 ATP synthase subunit B [Oscillospiraceae bacterium]